MDLGSAALRTTSSKCSIGLVERVLGAMVGAGQRQEGQDKGKTGTGVLRGVIQLWTQPLFNRDRTGTGGTENLEISFEEVLQERSKAVPELMDQLEVRH